MSTMPHAVSEYLQALEPARAEMLVALRDEICKHIDPRFGEGIQYGIPSWFVPHAIYPQGYHCAPKEPVPFISLASQKNHVGLYLFCIYCDPDEHRRFVEEWKESGMRLDMGKACIRIRRIEEIPFGVIGRAIKRISIEKFLTAYEAGMPASARKKRSQR